MGLGQIVIVLVRDSHIGWVGITAAAVLPTADVLCCLLPVHFVKQHLRLHIHARIRSWSSFLCAPGVVE